MTELYFPADLIRPLDQETFVDCGAFTGDTIEAFLAQRQGRADRIVAIEPDPVNRAAMQERIDGWGTRAPQSMKIEPFAVGSERGILQFEFPARQVRASALARAPWRSPLWMSYSRAGHPPT